MKRLAILILTLGLAAGPAAAEMLGVRALVGAGQKSLSHSDWGDLDKQVALSLDLEAKLPLIPVSGVLGYLVSGKEADVPNGSNNQEIEMATTEFSLGIRKTLEFGPLMPFVGGGICRIGVTADRPVSPFDDKTDETWGYWVSGGLRYQLAGPLMIGAHLRRSWGEVDLFGSKVEAGGTTILGEIGLGF